VPSSLFPQDVIARKRDGQSLSAEEVGAFVRGATDGSWTDYQLSALLMAIFLRGMSTEERVALTEAMMHSGTVADLSSIRAAKVDKHSTGGVGDKVSIHLAPMVAACGVAVPMISGRGLGHTGGTLDKLESIPGFRVNLSLSEYAAQIERLGLALIGQTAELAPADRKLYALRDATATVESIPLICASIMCKKLAEGIDALVLDVKFGRGAFMKEMRQARELAEAMVSIGNGMGRPTRALLTRMDQPLGRCIGNVLEIAECIECLRGQGPEDLMEVTFALAAEMLLLAKAAASPEEARERLEQAIRSGAALDKFRQMVQAQGGEVGVVDDIRQLPSASIQAAVPSPADGYIASVDARAIGVAAMRLGAGRARAEDRIDPVVGFSSLVKEGERVGAGQPLAIIHASDPAAADAARSALLAAITLGERPEPRPPLVAGRVE
jgi:pyrimidine-nucleoside phosphorylase